MAVLATLVVFLIANTVPGDPVLAQLGDMAASNPDTVAEWRAKWGLDLPLWQRYWHLPAAGWRRATSAPPSPRSGRCWRISRSTRRPRSNSPRVTFLLALVVGIPLGIAAAVWRDSWVDSLARVDLAARRLLAHLLARLHHAGHLLRRAGIAPGPGRLDPIAFPPEGLTGLFLVDSLLARDWETFRDAAAHLVLPSHRAGGRDHRADHPHHARRDAGQPRPGLRAGRPRQGAAGAAHRPAPRPAERADARW